MYGPNSKTSLIGILPMFMLAATAHAQTAQNVDPCLSDERCTALYESGITLSKAGQFSAALDNYRAAYARKPVPWLLINMGRVEQKMGRTREAIVSYQEFLNSRGPQQDPESARTARQYLKQAQQDLANPKQPQVIFVKEYGPRPTWRLGVGGAMIGLGVVGIALGAFGLSRNGKCQDEPIAPATQCMTVFNTLPAGLGYLISGGGVAAAGTVLLALPGPRNQVAEQPRSESAPRAALTMGGGGSGSGLQLVGTY